MFKGIVLKRVLPFILAAFSGAFVYYMFAPIGVPAVQTSASGSGYVSSGGTGICRGHGSGQGYGSGSGSGSGSGLGSGGGSGNDSFVPVDETGKLTIKSKPAAKYTDAARENNIEGSVRLKVTLLPSGEVGSISVVNGLPDGLTEQAIAAARKIKFEPKRIDGRPVSTTVTIDYSFDIY
jgi:TonB family protein